MTLRSRHRATALMLALSAAAYGCSAKEEPVKAESVSNAKLEGSVSECVGRWLVDVPGPVDFGAAYFTTGSYAEFFDYTPDGLKFSTRARGGVVIGPVAFAESQVLDGVITDARSTVPVSKFRRMAGILGVHQFNYSVDSSEEYRLRKEFADQSERLRNWAGPGKFQISIHSEEDQRGRFYWKDPAQIKFEDPKPGQSAELAMPPSEEPLARDVLQNLVPRYSVRKPGHMPQGAGICTPHGFFADPAKGTERDTGVSVSFVDPRFTNLALHVQIKTRMPHTETALIPTEDIRKAITPWDAAREMAKEHKKSCRTQQGTASRDIFGACAFAGATGIDDHWPVQYMKLANGQEARILVLTYPGAINDYKVYEVIIETAGRKGSVHEPRIVVTAEGFGKLSDEAPFRGKEPPALQEAFKAAVAIAKSLRPRSGAIASGVPVVDSWAKFRK
jgi:hypothetical protein